MVVMTETLAVITTPFLCTLFSYMPIIVMVLGVPSVAGKWMVFSTCDPHLTMVVLFYGSIIYVYFIPLSMYSMVKDLVATVRYMTVTPMLNPFIYSLRNKDMKGGLRKLRDRINSLNEHDRISQLGGDLRGDQVILPSYRFSHGTQRGDKRWC